MTLNLIISVLTAASLDVYPQWSSDILYIATSGPFDGVFHGNMVYDRTGKRMYQYIPTVLPFAPASYVGTGLEYLNQSIFMLTDGAYLSANNQTVRFMKGDGIGFDDMFSFLKVAENKGTETLNGTLTHRYEFSPTPLDHFIYNMLPPNKTDKFLTPYRTFTNMTSAAIPGQNKQVQISSTYYLNFVIGDQQEQVFNELNKTIVDHPPTCNSTTDPVVISEVEMYIFHPENDYNISDQNLADLIGDTVFICQDVNNTAVDDYQLISLYKIKLNTNWGQYTMCNGYNPPKCTGSEHFYVGREGPYFLGERAGQCTTHPESGTWWSLPAGGRCSSSTSILNKTCTWDIVEKVKTINSSCILHDQLIAACRDDARLPFPTASKILYNGFSETDPSKGGCPSL